MLLASCPVPLFDLARVILEPCGGYRVLIPTICMLSDLFRVFLPQRRHKYAGFQNPRTILFYNPFSSFLGLGSQALGWNETPGYTLSFRVSMSVCRKFMLTIHAVHR